MLYWHKTNQVTKDDGEEVITYKADGTDLVIETRKKEVRRANGRGWYVKPRYFLVNGNKETEYHLICLAKAAAESF